MTYTCGTTKLALLPASNPASTGRKGQRHGESSSVAAGATRPTVDRTKHERTTHLCNHRVHSPSFAAARPALQEGKRVEAGISGGDEHGEAAGGTCRRCKSQLATFQACSPARGQSPHHRRRAPCVALPP